jgi:hypothetical protein
MYLIKLVVDGIRYNMDRPAKALSRRRTGGVKLVKIPTYLRLNCIFRPG